jgi:hypothetical protein
MHFGYISDWDQKYPIILVQMTKSLGISILASWISLGPPGSICFPRPLGINRVLGLFRRHSTRNLNLRCFLAHRSPFLQGLLKGHCVYKLLRCLHPAPQPSFALSLVKQIFHTLCLKLLGTTPIHFTRINHGQVKTEQFFSGLQTTTGKNESYVNITTRNCDLRAILSTGRRSWRVSVFCTRWLKGSTAIPRPWLWRQNAS